MMRVIRASHVVQPKKQRYFILLKSACLSMISRGFIIHFPNNQIYCKKVTSKEYTPNTLETDSADALTRGFIDVFMRLVNRINCLVHVIRNIDDYLSSIEEHERNQIRYQILQIQASTTKTIFEAAKLLFLNQHRKSTNEGIKICVKTQQKTDSLHTKMDGTKAI
jgi:hypothetical protein